MAYKAVFINESHIAHSNWKHSYGLHGSATYQYVPTHNGIGNPHHGVGGMFTQNPMGNQSTSGNNTSTNPPPIPNNTPGGNSNNSSGSFNPDDFAKAAKKTKQIISDGGDFVKKMMPDKIYVPLDLSNMSDEQLRAANNRAQLESQYNQYFNPPKQNKSKEWVDVAITGANLLLSVGAIAAPIVWDVIKSKKQGG